MPFVKRDGQGRVVGVSVEPAPGFEEEPDADLGELRAALALEQGDSLAGTDQDFIRVLEDVVNLLIDKGVFLFTDLPASAQQKILERQRLRRFASDRLQLLEDD